MRISFRSFSLILILLVGFTSLFAQEEMPESITNSFKGLKGEKRVEVLLELSQEHKDTYPANAFDLAEDAVDLATEMGDGILTTRANTNLGVLYRNRGDYEEGLKLFLNALRSAEEINNQSLQADALHKLASSNLWLFEYEVALQYAKREVEILESLEEQEELASALNLMGLTLANLQQYDSALLVLKRSRSIADAIQDKRLIYKATLNIGDTKRMMAKDGQEIRKNLTEALALMEESQLLAQKLNDKFGMAITHLKIGQTHAVQMNYVAAFRNFTEGMKQAREIGATSIVRNGYKYLMETYQQKGDYENAFVYLERYQALNDSLLGAQNGRIIGLLKAQYKLEESEMENKLLRDEQTIQNYQTYALVALVLAIMAFGIVLWRRGREKNMANRLLQEQNKEIQEKANRIKEQSDLLASKGQKIQDSVMYARRIQNAVQINETDIFFTYPEYFILSHPRDIVSGDVYWFEQTENCFLVAVADCTGHGIPGALMTILCNSLLNDILNELPDFQPAAVLQELDKRLKSTLHQQVSNINDGMEIALLKINPEKQEITYSGAKMPLICHHDGMQEVFKGGVFPIGGHDFKSEKVFSDHVISFNKGDAIYIASDGYQDQFGGRNTRKFMRKNFRNLLKEVTNLPMEDQRIVLEERFMNWKGKEEQTDDVMVMGIRL